MAAARLRASSQPPLGRQSGGRSSPASSISSRYSDLSSLDLRVNRERSVSLSDLELTRSVSLSDLDCMTDALQHAACPPQISKPPPKSRRFVTVFAMGVSMLLGSVAGAAYARPHHPPPSPPPPPAAAVEAPAAEPELPSFLGEHVLVAPPPEAASLMCFRSPFASFRRQVRDLIRGPRALLDGLWSTIARHFLRRRPKPRY